MSAKAPTAAQAQAQFDAADLMIMKFLDVEQAAQQPDQVGSHLQQSDLDAMERVAADTTAAVQTASFRAALSAHDDANVVFLVDNVLPREIRDLQAKVAGLRSQAAPSDASLRGRSVSPIPVVRSVERPADRPISLPAPALTTTLSFPVSSPLSPLAQPRQKQPVLQAAAPAKRAADVVVDKEKDKEKEKDKPLTLSKPLPVAVPLSDAPRSVNVGRVSVVRDSVDNIVKEQERARKLVYTADFSSPPAKQAVTGVLQREFEIAWLSPFWRPW